MLNKANEATLTAFMSKFIFTNTGKAEFGYNADASEYYIRLIIDDNHMVQFVFNQSSLTYAFYNGVAWNIVWTK